MGLRATVIKKYEVEYGNANGFNYDPDTLSNIIREYCDDFYNGDDGYGGLSTDAYWEIDKGQFWDMLQEIMALPDKEFNKRMQRDWQVGKYGLVWAGGSWWGRQPGAAPLAPRSG